MLLKKIKSIVKRLLPASYKKIDCAESELLHAVNVLREEIQSLHSELQKTQDQSNERINYLWQKFQDEANWKRDELTKKIDSVWQKVQDEANWKRDDMRLLFTDLKQTVENESNWKRADIINDMKPILSELKKTVENESNWKRHDIQKAIDESQYRIKNIEKLLSISLYDSLKKEKETQTDFEKRMMIHLPKSICAFMHERNMYMEEVVHVLLWNHSEIPFEDLDYTWRYLIENSNTSSWILFEHYTRFLFQHGDLLDNLENIYLSKISEFEKWTPVCKLSYVSFLYYKNKEEKAIEVLKKYISQHGEENLDHFIPVAFLAKKYFGISNDSVTLSAKRFETMRNNDGLFEKLAATGSFAIVGNGPQEKGNYSGSKIDSHDLVLRFNGYSLSKEFNTDYGEKVDIWGNCGNVYEDKNEKGNFKYFMYLPGIYDEPINDRFLDNFENAFTVDMLAIRKEIYEKTGLYCTSNGFNLIFAVKKLNKNFSADDCFGFSFKDEVISDKWMHYDGIELNGMHSLKDEKYEIQKIFNK